MSDKEIIYRKVRLKKLPHNTPLSVVIDVINSIEVIFDALEVGSNIHEFYERCPELFEDRDET